MFSEVLSILSSLASVSVALLAISDRLRPRRREVATERNDDGAGPVRDPAPADLLQDDLRQ